MSESRAIAFSESTAVITGAASGIGFAIARELIARGANVALLDVEDKALGVARLQLDPEGTRTIALSVDVSDDVAMRHAAHATRKRFEAVHLLFNNAGVDMAGVKLMDTTSADWRWVTGVNLYGVIHGLRHFLPLVLKHGSNGHVINTASVAGFLPVAGELGLGPYVATKHAVVGLTESLMLELAGTNVGVSLLVPGTVRTRIATSSRNRPDPIANEQRSAHSSLQKAIDATGIDPVDVAKRVLTGILTGQKYIFTHEATRQRIR